jgi:hypothetical protein
MARGLRKPPQNVLTDAQINALKCDIEAIGADLRVFVFNDSVTVGTGYVSSLDLINVTGNVLPELNSEHPRDLMSARAVLAHEYYGHRPYRMIYLEEDVQIDMSIKSKLAALSWVDEFRASYIAAKISPGLSDDDKKYLIMDALERAKEAGVTISHNRFIRRVLYGYDDGE